jgi:hypothetical protein
MQIVFRFLKGEVTLWKSFWLVSVQPLLPFICEVVYNLLIPKPIYPYEYSFYSIVIRLSVYLLFLLMLLGLVHGTWKSANSYEGKLVWKWLARFVLLVNTVFLLFGLFFNAVELVHIDTKKYPYELKLTS